MIESEAAAAGADDFYVKGALDESQPQPDVAGVTGRPARTFRQWAQVHAGLF